MPTILAGYHLLHGANLTTSERASLIATAAMGPETETLGAVILTWQDSELKERDEKQKRKEGKRPHTRRAFELSESECDSEACKLSEQDSDQQEHAWTSNDQTDSEQEAQLLDELSDETKRLHLQKP